MESNTSLNDTMESFAGINLDRDPIQCHCNSTCMSKRCPCKALNQDCNDSCTCGTKKKCCKNNKPVPSSDSEAESSDDDDESEVVTTRKRKRAKTTGTGQDIDQSLQEHRHRLDEENRHIQDFVNRQNITNLRTICTDLLHRSPGAYADYIAQSDGTDVDQAIDGTDVDTPGPNQRDQPDHRPNPPGPPSGGPPNRQPLWCKCGHCRTMPRDIENKCCQRRNGQPCITTTGQFYRLCLDHMVVEIAMRVNDDILAENPLRNNDNFRHHAYKTYIYWQHGRLGAGNRRVIPSCCVWAIRSTWPDPHGQYRGFIEGVGHLQD